MKLFSSVFKIFLLDNYPIFVTNLKSDFQNFKFVFFPLILTFIYSYIQNLNEFIEI